MQTAKTRNRFLYYLGLVIGVWFLLFYDTLESIVTIWMRSDTFAHGFIILPISAYLIWRKKTQLAGVSLRPQLFSIMPLLMLVCAWLLAYSAGVMVVQQLAVAAMLPMIIWGIMGNAAVSVILFPLSFLIFAVPFGEGLVPVLQNFVALFSVWALGLTGIPVFMEGLYISVPAGDFEVAVACSGIRYLIASLALGSLYAYLNYCKLYKQILFVIMSIVVPIVANGIRAYGIIMIAQLSDMEYATGVDHLIYGWLFFGLVMFVLFWAGSFWHDNPVHHCKTSTQSADIVTDSVSQKQIASASLLIILALSSSLAGVPWVNYLPTQSGKVLVLPATLNSGWQQSPMIDNWKPNFIGQDQEVVHTYAKHADNVLTYVAYYRSQTQGKELVSSQNTIYDRKNWLLVKKTAQQASLSNSVIPVDEFELRTNGKRKLVWGWYYVFGETMTNPITTKIAQAIGMVTGFAREGIFVCVAIDYDQNPAIARQTLQTFVADNWLAIKQILDAD